MDEIFRWCVFCIKDCCDKSDKEDALGMIGTFILMPMALFSGVLFPFKSSRGDFIIELFCNKPRCKNIK